jgi:serine/threonine protein kinase
MAVPDTVSHYRILRKAGGGGMGVVYEALDLQLGRRAAIKFLPPDVAGDPHAVNRLKREARAASALSHPGVCTVYECGEHEGQPFIVFELLDGRSLRGILGGRPLPLDVVLDLGVQVADALGCAHRAGIVHRDIKPSNLFVTEPRRIKVLDFGLAKPEPFRRVRAVAGDDEATAGGSPETFTEDGRVAGTAPYMSPEQAVGDEVDHRTDLFSFGAVLYEMATGRQAFSGQTEDEVRDAVLNRVPPAPSRLNPAVPAPLDVIIAKALDKDREYRYQSAADLRVDLQRLRRSTSTVPMPAPHASPEDRRRPRWKDPRVWLAAGLALLALALAAMAGAYLW